MAFGCNPQEGACVRTVGLVGMLLISSLPLPAQGPSGDADAIRAELDSTAAGWNRNDPARYLAAYDTSMRSLTRSGPDPFRMADDSRSFMI